MRLLLLGLLLLVGSAIPVSFSAATDGSTTTTSSSATAPSPSQLSLSTLMSKKGCKTFADLLTSTADAEKTFDDNIAGGLTVFCPIDQAMKAFLPKFKNLTADGKLSILFYHGIPIYNSIQMLKSDNGVMNTLATDGISKNFNLTIQNEGEAVTIRTRVTKAAITRTLIDEDPLAVYTIDDVLEPMELFEPAVAPKEAGKRHRVASPPASAGPEPVAADQKAADENSGGRGWVGRWAVAAAVVAAAVA